VSAAASFSASTTPATRHARWRTGVIAGAFAVCLSAASALGAQTTTITFNEITVPPGTVSQPLPTPYATQGYVFGCVNASTGAPCGTPGLAVVGPASFPAYPGSSALYNGNLAFGITTLARQDGGAFSLLAVDMARLSFLVPGGPMVFEGMLAGGGTVTQTIDVTPVAPGTLATYGFASTFQNLLSVRFRGGGFGPGSTSIASVVDNVVVSAGPATVVPEPSTWALLSTGLLVLGGVAAARRRTQASA
jgi:hypothetical protein